jgi:glutamine amidotransferase
MKYGIIDYGMGNIYSLKAAILKVKPEAEIIYSNQATELATCEKYFLPGVGNFKLAMEKIHELGLKETILKEVRGNNKPIMGICLGMQLLFAKGTESGDSDGLGLLDGCVRKFNESNGLKVPHIGFNEVKVGANTSVFKGVTHTDFYFVHSFRVTDTTANGAVLSTCQYGEEFVAAIEDRNVVGVQFHPEKSQSNGLSLLANFLNANLVGKNG